MPQKVKHFLCLSGLLLIMLIMPAAAIHAQNGEGPESRLPRTKGNERFVLLVELTETYKTKSPQNAFNYGKEALQLLETLPHPDRKRELPLLLNMSYLGSRVGKYEEAKQYAETAVSIAREIKAEEKHAKALFYLGNAFLNMSRYDRAQDNFGKSIRIYRKRKDLKHVGILYNALGLTYWELSD